jgi:hypothetical protein
MRNEALGRRNALTAIALVLVAFTFVPYVGEERIVWMMWRDTPLLALSMTAAAIVLAVASRRVPGGTSSSKQS